MHTLIDFGGENMKLVRQVWSLFDRPQRRLAVGLFFLMLLGAGFEALGIGLVMPFIALVAEPTSVQEMPLLPDLLAALGVETGSGVVIAAGLGLLGIYLIKNAFLALMYYAQFRFVFNNQVRLSRRLFDAYLHSPYSFHLHRNSAQLLRNVNDEVRMTFAHVVIPLLTLAVELMVVLVLGALLMVVEPVVAPIAIVSFGLVSYGFYRSVRKKTVQLGKEQQHHAGLMIQWVHQGLGGVKEAKVAGCEDYFLEAYNRSSKRYARAMRFHRFVKEIPRNVVETIGLGGMILVVVLLVARGQNMTHILPVLGLFAMAAIRLLPSLTRIIAALTGLRHFRPSVNVITGDLDLLRVMEPKKNEGAAADQPPITFDEKVELRGVSFRYPEADEVTLTQLDLEIECGESIAFVGASGAGKTTTVDLLLGLLPPDAGQILVDGRSIEENLRSWQDQLGYIAQPTYLMDDTIRRNVAFGIPDEEIDDGQIWQVLEDAQLAKLVSSLPGQLDTFIGEGGVRISGGQRQRLGIARALYRRPTLLVLDEATSALDNATEKEINAAIQRLSKTMTMVIIAHRLSTVRHCDRLFFLSQGRVVDSGTYDELLARNFEFQQMVRATDELSGTAAGPGSSMRLK